MGARGMRFGFLALFVLVGCAGPNWIRVSPSDSLPKERALNVGFLVVDGVYNTELTAPYDIFPHTVFHTQPGMTVFTVSPDGESVRTF
ncbi:MAG: glutamine amidotransferase, partial [Myxococcota bacterium]